MPVADNVHIQGGGGKHSQENMIEVMAYLFQQGIDTVSQIWSSSQESFMVLKFHWCNYQIHDNILQEAILHHQLLTSTIESAKAAINSLL